MFLQQRERGHTTMLSYLFIWDNSDVHQRKRVTVESFGQGRVAEPIQPAGRVWIGAAFTSVKKHGYHQRQLFMSGIQVTLHGGYCITQQPERHMLIWRRLMLDKHMHIAVVAAFGFQAVKYIAEVLAQIIFNKRA